MNQGVYPLAASMINQINRLDQISNNLANVILLDLNKKGQQKQRLTTIYIKWKVNKSLC